MTFNDRVMNGERQANWWCGYCYSSGRWLAVPADEAGRLRVYGVLTERYEAHPCTHKPHRLRRIHRRVL